MEQQILTTIAPKRVCDNCKIKKRKCSGELPCYTCKKAVFKTVCTYDTIHRYGEDSIPVLHSMFIDQLEFLPKSFMPFSGLADFEVDPEASCLATKWVTHLAFLQDVMLFLGSMTFIHLPYVNMPYETFELSSLSPGNLNHQQVLIVLLRAVVAIVKSLHGGLESSELAVPGLAGSSAALSIYLVSSSALIASRLGPVPGYEAEVEKLIIDWIQPTLFRIGKIKAMGSSFHSQLKLLLGTQFRQF